MRRPALLLLALLFLSRVAAAQASAPNGSSQGTSKPAAPAAAKPATNADLQATVNRLLDLLKNQQAVLDDIQYDRRLQSRQIQSLEERLEETLLENDRLKNKISNLESTAAVAPTPGTPATPAPTPPAAIVEPAAPPPPTTNLPPPPVSDNPGAPSWHRLFTLSGTDSKNTELFHIEGSTWRVFWHNLDKSGNAYKNTSALFISAFPKDDTIPQPVCSKLGTGGDSTELLGPGNYYLKVEASGGSWELAVEDFH
jgi:Spy/CpxP family protein refolding chaperone